jgi:hypothetical protein
MCYGWRPLLCTATAHQGLKFHPVLTNLRATMTMERTTTPSRTGGCSVLLTSTTGWFTQSFVQWEQGVPGEHTSSHPPINKLTCAASHTHRYDTLTTVYTQARTQCLLQLPVSHKQQLQPAFAVANALSNTTPNACQTTPWELQGTLQVHKTTSGRASRDGDSSDAGLHAGQLLQALKSHGIARCAGRMRIYYYTLRGLC